MNYYFSASFIFLLFASVCLADNSMSFVFGCPTNDPASEQENLDVLQYDHAHAYLRFVQSTPNNQFINPVRVASLDGDDVKDDVYIYRGFFDPNLKQSKGVTAESYKLTIDKKILVDWGGNKFSKGVFTVSPENSTLGSLKLPQALTCYVARFVDIRIGI